MRTVLTPLLAACVALAAAPATAQTERVETGDIRGAIAQIGTHLGEMSMTMPAAAGEGVSEVLRFEPYQMLDDLFRSDIVLLMRHGPTDWSKRDRTDVAPDDCDNQRIMTEDGKTQMRDLGALLVANELVPSRVVVSQWCRNQETFDAIVAGMERVDPEIMRDIKVDTDPSLNLLLSLQGAPNVTDMRERISAWDGEGGEAEGPLLVISHFTNIQELTEFSVYEGEMLVVDPTRANRVLGYIRLGSAKPDIGHFDASVVPDE
ncbi:histidine phosphatase family protein [Jannaschia sp. W003]|uniref:histidine phosphatase family protein n=1 Tax=Jannaschia sp. W003 TaxID=2867012 RepID=UPI0021A46A27|nr:histidine phosphatase family protein [Jannaschia sp. W003]UWQ22447.1 histidine phosphatase family protein [Jannaschia sp. W003]